MAFCCTLDLALDSTNLMDIHRNMATLYLMVLNCGCIAIAGKCGWFGCNWCRDGVADWNLKPTALFW